MEVSNCLSSSVKRRAYLDFLTNRLSKNQEKVWDNLFLRSYLRNGDFFALSLRLLILSLLIIIFLPQSMIATIFVGLFQYLLLFQLLALYGAVVLLVELLAALLFFKEKIMVLFILLVFLILYAVYLPYKLKGLVDERA